MTKPNQLKFLVSFALLAISILLFIPLQEFAFSNQNWLPEEHPIEKNKRYLDEEFNQGERLILLIQLPEPYFQQKYFVGLQKTEEKLKKIPKITQIQSPSSAKSIFKDTEDTLHNITYAQAIDDNILSWQNYPKHLKQSPYWGRLISSDKQTIAIVITLDIVFGGDNSNLRQKVYQEISKIMDTSMFRNYYFSGETELLHRLDSLSKNDLQQLLPIAIITLCLLVFLIYRQFYFSLIVITVVLLNLLITFNIMQATGIPFNVLSANLPLLVLVIAMTDSIHILRRWQTNENITNIWQKSCLCWRETWLPCLFTSLTSAVGFGVFAFSEIVPLKNFGEITFVSILLAYPVIMITNLLILYTFAPKKRATKSYIFTPFSIQGVLKQSKGIWSITTALLLITVLMLPQATTESNFLDVFFSPSSKTVASFNIADKKLHGSGSIDIILQSTTTETFKKIQSFEQIKKQVSTLQKIPLINSIESLLDPILMVHRPLSDQLTLYPQTDNALTQELLFLEFSRSDQESDVLSSSVDFLYQNTRIHLYTPNLPSNQIEQLLNKITPSLNPLPYQIIITGVNAYFQQLSQFILKTQLTSMLLTGSIILLGFILFFGLKLGIIGALTSFIPVLIVLGGQIALQIPFDFATVLVASVSLGLAIDDTSHFLHRFKHHLHQKLTTKTALQHTVNDLQQPILTTSLILLVGFLVLCLSELVVIQKFSLLTASAIAFSLVMVFILLPNALSSHRD